MTLRILQIIETGGPGGAETVFSRLVAGLHQRGHVVHCLVGNGSWLPPQLQEFGLSYVILDQHRLPAIAIIGRIRKAILTQRPHLIHAHLFGGTLFAALAAAGTGVPVICTLHGSADIPPSGIKRAVKAALFRPLVSQLVSVSASLQQTALAALAMPAGRSCVVYNGVPTGNAFQAETLGHMVTPTANADLSRDFRMLSLGNIRPAKGHETLLRAVRLLLDRGIRVRLTIAGEPDRSGLYESLLALHQQLGLGNFVTFVGFVAQPATLLAEADGYVLPSLSEGFSLATVEAMLASVPVVATRSGGPEEIVQDGVTGILVSPGDPESLANGIARLVADVPSRERMRHAALLDARERFGLDTMIDRYTTLYELVCQRTSRTADSHAG